MSEGGENFKNGQKTQGEPIVGKPRVGRIGRGLISPAPDASGEVQAQLTHSVHKPQDLDIDTEKDAWFKPIVEEATAILDESTQDSQTRADIMIAVLGELEDRDIDTPWATVFSSEYEDVEVLGEKLLKVLQTPDGKTSAYNPDTRLAMQRLKELLTQHENLDQPAELLALRLVGIAAGREGKQFDVFRDLGRKWPQYAKEWGEKLKEQLGEENFSEMNPELVEILKKTEGAALAYDAQQGELHQEEEGNEKLAKRVLEFFPDDPSVSGADQFNLSLSNDVLQAGLQEYWDTAYSIRGLPEPSAK